MRNKKGFTLIELLTVIVIIGILTSIGLINYQSAQKKFALQRSVVKLASDIRRAQEMAMSAKECPPGTACAGQTPQGYGVYIDVAQDCITGNPSGEAGKEYCLYADRNGDKIFSTNPPPADVIIKKITLEKKVFICWLVNPSHINFTPPDPEVTLRAASATQDSLSIFLHNTISPCPASPYQVWVNKIGAISITL